MATLITGANGQIGTELVEALSETCSVVATDITAPSTPNEGVVYEELDVTDESSLREIVEAHRVDTVYHLASLLSVTGEKQPDRAWDVNLEGLKNVLDLARERGMKVFWPSSIAVFGRATPQKIAPQTTVLDPSTMYGVTKVSGEFLCRYYFDHFGVDVRSVRYPGLISHKTRPGGGTTDYAVDVFYKAADGAMFECFVGPDTRLPMMYMPDAIRAATGLMHANARFLTVRTSYNISAVSFSAGELVAAIQERLPDFKVEYRPDRRQKIADSWPDDVDDHSAREDWGWRHEYALDAIVDDMLAHLVRRQEDVSSL